MLDRIDARIDAGECVALMGPSGSGKSTLMNIIGCLDRPTSGDYLFCGREVGRLDDDELSRIRKSDRVRVQNFHLLPRLTAAGNVELPLVYAGVSRRERHDRAMELLRRVGLMDRGTSACRAVGRPEAARCRRTGTGQRPVLILADEPTGNLDSRSGAQILDLLLTLHREGRTILIVTHDETVATRAGRVIHLRDGRI